MDVDSTSNLVGPQQKLARIEGECQLRQRQERQVEWSGYWRKQ